DVFAGAGAIGKRGDRTVFDAQGRRSTERVEKTGADPSREIEFWMRRFAVGEAADESRADMFARNAEPAPRNAGAVEPETKGRVGERKNRIAPGQRRAAVKTDSRAVMKRRIVVIGEKVPRAARLVKIQGQHIPEEIERRMVVRRAGD